MNLVSEAKLYTGQDYRLLIDTEQDLTEATGLTIVCVKPNKQRLEWPASLEPGTISVVYRLVPAAENDLAGQWRFQVAFDVAAGHFLTDIGIQTILSKL